MDFQVFVACFRHFYFDCGHLVTIEGWRSGFDMSDLKHTKALLEVLGVTAA